MMDICQFCLFGLLRDYLWNVSQKSEFPEKLLNYLNRN